jgi:hypothetical protein
MQSLRSSPSPAPITTTCPIPHPALPYSSPDASHLFAPLARDPSLAPLYPKLFFLHGVWSRFFPAMSELRRVIDSGEIGEVSRCEICRPLHHNLADPSIIDILVEA